MRLSASTYKIESERAYNPFLISINQAWVKGRLSIVVFTIRSCIFSDFILASAVVNDGTS